MVCERHYRCTQHASGTSRREPGGQGERAPGSVEDVEVIARCSMGQEVADLGERPIDAEGFDDLGLVSGGLDAPDQPVRQRGAAQAGDPCDLFEREHRHDARDDGHADPGCAASIHEAVVGLVVEEQLGGDERCPGVDLAPQVDEIGFERGRLGVLLRIAGHAQAEIGVQLLEQGDDIAAEAQVVLERSRRGQAVGQVAPQGHDVADSPRVVRLCDGRNFRPGVGDRGQMRHDREAEFASSIMRPAVLSSSPAERSRRLAEVARSSEAYPLGKSHIIVREYRKHPFGQCVARSSHSKFTLLNLVVAVGEAIVTGFVVEYLGKVRRDLLAPTRPCW